MFNRLKIKNETKVFRRFLISYMAVLLIPIVLFSAFYIYLYSNYRKELLESGNAISEQIKSIADMRLEEINDAVYDITYTPYFREIAQLSPVMTVDDRSAIEDFITDISNSIKTDNGFITDYYIFLPKSGYVIGTDSAVPNTMFYPYYISYEGMDYDAWRKWLIGTGDSFFYKTLNVNGVGRMNKKQIAVVQTIPIYNLPTAYQPRFVLHIDCGFLNNLVKNSSDEYSTHNINIISTSNELLFYSSAEYENMVSYSDSDRGIIKYKGHEVLYQKSYAPVQDWKYIIFRTTYKIDSKIRGLQAIFIILLVLTAVLGFFLAKRFSIRNYRPIEGILELFGSKAKKDIDEYDTIRESITGVMNETRNLRQTVDRHMSIIKEDIFKKYLYGRLDKESQEQLLCELNYDTYMMFLCEFDYVNDSEYALILENIDKYNKIKDDGQWIINVSRTRTLIISGLDGKSDTLCDTMIDKIRGFIKGTNAEVTIAVSDSIFGAEALRYGLTEVGKMIDYKLIKGLGSVIYSDDIQGANCDDDYYYPEELEQQFRNHIKIAEVDKAIEILNSIIDENLNKRKLSVEMARLVFFNIIDTINKVMKDIKVDSQKIFGENPVLMMLRCQSVQDIYTCVDNFIITLKEYFDVYKVDRNEKMKMSLIEYITENYKDRDISLTMVANYFDVNPSYLSRYFKEQFGENFLDYLSKYRISVSKKYLASTDLKIQEIAELVGYSSANSFIRVFKKYEGVSPSKYRE